MEQVKLLHIPRTGGSSLITALDKNDYFTNLGHKTWDELTNPDWILNVITLLREPIARCISQYQYWLMRHSGGDLREDWLYRSPHDDPHRIRCNAMTGFLAGTLEPRSYHLDRAKQRLIYDVTFGISEHFEDSLKYFQECFPEELKDISYDGIIHNKSRTVAGITKDELKAIRETNIYDIELYEFAIKFWERRIK